MNPTSFLDVAEWLLTGESEADWRSAVSRAYYAAFHVARQLLQDCGFAVPRMEQVHVFVSHRMNNCGHSEVCGAASAYAGQASSSSRSISTRAISQPACRTSRTADWMASCNVPASREKLTRATPLELPTVASSQPAS